MSKSLDIVVDTCVMRLYDKPKDERVKTVFTWLYGKGTLCVSNSLLHEYNRHGNPLLAGLIQHLLKNKRFVKVGNGIIKDFKLDQRHKYTCNVEDIANARLVFVSQRKKLVSFDGELRNSVNGFPLVDGIKPHAVDYPPAGFLD